MTTIQASAANDTISFPPPSVVWGEWKAMGEVYEAAPTDCLFATVYIAGVAHYAEAIAIVPQEPGDTQPQRAVEKMQDEFQAICEASGIEGRFLTVKIGERDYALIVTPGTQF